jgi:uncharacterized membrane protein
VRLRRLLGVGVVALALATFGCRKSSVDCTQPPAVACPDGGGPSFVGDVLPIFKQVCESCHAPDSSEVETPFLTNYRQIYGPTSGASAGAEATEIRAQVFENCSMPPATATVALTDDQRQTLLVWFACGAPDSPAIDAGTAD